VLTVASLFIIQHLLPPSLGATLPSPLFIGHWGANIAKAQVDASQYEPSLATICSTKKYNVIHIFSLASYVSVNQMPSLDLSTHCSFPTNTFPGWPKSSVTGLSLINCPAVGTDIKTCQSKGVKILLTISASQKPHG
jgi:chitinase